MVSLKSEKKTSRDNKNRVLENEEFIKTIKILFKIKLWWWW